MFRYIFPLLLVLLVGCSSKKADIDYDPSYKTNVLKTFSVIHQSHEYSNSLYDERISEAITKDLSSKGYASVSKEAADFHVTFMIRIKKEVPSNVSFGFGLGYFTRGTGLSLGTAHNTVQHKWIILINMVDPKTHKTFWSTTVTENIQEFKSPQESTEYFNKIVNILLKEFPAKAAANKTK